MRFELIKCHGSGNDFPLIDARAIDLGDADWAMVARALADRGGPVGGDGLLLLTAAGGATAFGMRMFNADGSEAETCLNGLRCVARAGFAAFGIDRAQVQLKTSIAEVAIEPEIAPGVTTVRETAGPAGLDSAAWLRIGAARVVEAVVPPLDAHATFTAVTIPNPHLIRFVETIDEGVLVTMGLRCEAAPHWLPGRANVSFVEQRGGDLFVRTFERGVGLTDSCGSAMAAASYAACLTGRVPAGRPLTVFNRGGMVRATVGADAMVTLSGNATFEWTGDIDVDLETGVAADLVVRQHYAADIAAWAALIARLG